MRYDYGDKYFEAHVTVGPMNDGVTAMVTHYGWNHSEVTFDDDPDEVGKFCTFRHGDIDFVKKQIVKLVEYLKGHDVVVRRYKVEFAIVDSNQNDEWKLL